MLFLCEPPAVPGCPVRREGYAGVGAVLLAQSRAQDVNSPGIPPELAAAAAAAGASEDACPFGNQSGPCPKVSEGGGVEVNGSFSYIADPVAWRVIDLIMTPNTRVQGPDQQAVFQLQPLFAVPSPHPLLLPPLYS